MMQRQDTDKIKLALSSGRLSEPDATGMQHFIYAQCPTDGQDSPIYRTEKRGNAITKAIFRCPSCGEEFSKPPEEMSLR